MKCQLCRKRIKLDKSKIYQVVTNKRYTLFGNASEVLFDAIDCEKCGTQNLLCTRLTKCHDKKESQEEEE